MMLVLSRKISERIRIGDSIVLTVVKVSGGNVRLGIEAPPEVQILRDELLATDEETSEGIVTS
jgi:carbon storage regulator